MQQHCLLSMRSQPEEFAKRPLLSMWRKFIKSAHHALVRCVENDRNPPVSTNTARPTEVDIGLFAGLGCAAAFHDMMIRQRRVVDEGGHGLWPDQGTCLGLAK